MFFMYIESHQENRELVQSIQDAKNEALLEFERQANDERDIMASQVADRSER